MVGSFNKQTGIRVKQFTLIPVILLAVIACSSETRQLFFDIKPPTAEELAAKPSESPEIQTNQTKDKSLSLSSSMFSFLGIDESLPPPAIEEVLEWEKAEQMLPKDEEDNVDWSEALRQGLIRPRTGSDPRTLLMTTFQWDFIIPAVVDEDEDEDEDEDDEDEEVETENNNEEVDIAERDDEANEEDEDEDDEANEDDAYFPHSSHTQWLSCKNCHMTIYPFRRNPATMKEMKKGKSCGVCHGKKKVAFSLKACGRCHLNSE
jgi:c(7)-type cytochrome triheme protein